MKASRENPGGPSNNSKASLSQSSHAVKGNPNIWVQCVVYTGVSVICVLTFLIIRNVIESQEVDDGRMLLLKPIDASTIIVTKVRAFVPGEWQHSPGPFDRSRKVHVSLSIEEVLKGEGIPPCKDIEGWVIQNDIMGGDYPGDVGPGFWTDRDLEKGRSIILFSRGSLSNPQSLLDGAIGLDEVDREQGPIGDIKYLIWLSGLKPDEQASRLARYVTDRNATQSKYMAEYMAGLAFQERIPSDSPFYSLLSDPVRLRMSDDNKLLLWWKMRYGVQHRGPHFSTVSKVLVVALCRYIGGLEGRSDNDSNLMNAIVYWLPWLSDHGPAYKYFKVMAVNKTEYDRVMKALRELGRRRVVGEEGRRHLTVIRAEEN